MTKTKKFLSLVLAVLTLIGCMVISSCAIHTAPAFLDEASYITRGFSSISSIEITIDDEFDVFGEEGAGIDIYYSAEPYEGILTSYNINYKLEKVGYVGKAKMYFKNHVIHANLSSQKLSEEGYYYFVLSNGAMRYYTEHNSVCFYNASTVFGPEHHQYASLDFGAQITAFFNYIGSVFTNIFTNGRTY